MPTTFNFQKAKETGKDRFAKTKTKAKKKSGNPFAKKTAEPEADDPREIRKRAARGFLRSK